MKAGKALRTFSLLLVVLSLCHLAESRRKYKGSHETTARRSNTRHSNSHTNSHDELIKLSYAKGHNSQPKRPASNYNHHESAEHQPRTKSDHESAEHHPRKKSDHDSTEAVHQHRSSPHRSRSDDSSEEKFIIINNGPPGSIKTTKIGKTTIISNNAAPSPTTTRTFTRSSGTTEVPKAPPATVSTPAASIEPKPVVPVAPLAPVPPVCEPSVITDPADPTKGNQFYPDAPEGVPLAPFSNSPNQLPTASASTAASKPSTTIPCVVAPSIEPQVQLAPFAPGTFKAYEDQQTLGNPMPAEGTQ